MSKILVRPCKIPATTWAWLAGVIDGEGSIMMPMYHRGKWFSYRYHVTVSNTNRRLLEEIMKLTGHGRIHTSNRRNNKLHKTGYIWVATSTNAAIVLGKIRPWLVIKTRQADLLIEAIDIAQQNMCSKDNRCCPTRDPDMMARLDRRDKIAQIMKNLNRKGNVPNAKIVAKSRVTRVNQFCTTNARGRKTVCR